MISALISQKIETMVRVADPNPIRLGRKAITTFFLYTIQQRQDGQDEMLDSFLSAARASQTLRFMWHQIKPLFTILCQGHSGPS